MVSQTNLPTSLATGDVWLVQLDPTVGSEIQKTRPCVLISPPEMLNHLRTVIVAPMKTGSHPAAFRIPLTFKGKTGLIVLDQIRTIDKTRLVRREGAVQAATLKRTLLTLQNMFAPVN
jgi:mRNA interferase MazF